MIVYLLGFFLGVAVGYLMGRFKRIGKFWEFPGENYDD